MLAAGLYDAISQIKMFKICRKLNRLVNVRMCNGILFAKKLGFGKSKRLDGHSWPARLPKNVVKIHLLSDHRSSRDHSDFMSAQMSQI